MFSKCNACDMLTLLFTVILIISAVIAFTYFIGYRPMFAYSVSAISA